MKLIVMSQTISMICKSQEDIQTKFFDKGFTIKEVNKIQYLIKEL